MKIMKGKFLDHSCYTYSLDGNMSWFYNEEIILYPSQDIKDLNVDYHVLKLCHVLAAG